MTGADKKLNYPVYKGIKLTEEQSQNWDPEKIRKLLNGNGYESNMNTRILHDKIDKLEKFKEGYKQYNLLFEKLTKTTITKGNLMNLVKEILDLNLIKKLEMEMNL